MPRPKRCRFIDRLPVYRSFSPDDIDASESVLMTVDEFETLRLLDNEGLTQKQCAARMNVSRTTVTAIYDSARKKIENLIEKGQNTMRIAVTYDNGEIFQHFGHSEYFKLYDAENGVIVAEQVVSTNGSGHGALAGFLQAAQVDALICGGIGMGAQMALAETGITLYGGVSGSADAAAKALAEGNLTYDPNARCDHHEHHGGDCGHHHCGEHKCTGN